MFTAIGEGSGYTDCPDRVQPICVLNDYAFDSFRFSSSVPAE
jgi:hypothetical protein